MPVYRDTQKLHAGLWGLQDTDRVKLYRTCGKTGVYICVCGHVRILGDHMDGAGDLVCDGDTAGRYDAQ